MDRSPNGVDIYAEVGMEDAVPHPHDLTPRNVRVGRPRLLPNMGSRLSDDPDGVEGRPLVEVALGELIKGHSLDMRAGVKGV